MIERVSNRRKAANVFMAGLLVAVAAEACQGVPAAKLFESQGTGSGSAETVPLFFPEELQPLLNGWMDNEYQYNDYDSLKPLEDYVKGLRETFPVGGWKEVENQPSLKIWVGDSKSPELLKDSKAVFFKVGDQLRGFVWNFKSTYSLQGKGEDPVYGTMSHFSGEVQNNYEGTYTAQKPIPSDAPFKFYIDWRGPNKFAGHIYFRGHDRPFGGGKDQDSFPDNIKG